MRKALSKRLRFEVFKRDSFCCQYCSAKPPHVPLEVDHIIPVSKGGTNDVNNLITACFDCNRGKSDISLEIAPPTLSDKIERKKIAQDQYKQYQKLILAEKRQIQHDIDMVEEIYSRFFDEYCFTEKFKISVKTFIKKLGVVEVCDSMEIACAKIFHNQNKALAYFCGICWCKIREL